VLNKKPMAKKLSYQEHCPVCGSQNRRVFFEMMDVPTHCNILWPDRELARNCPRGDIRLAFCRDCSFVANVAFDPVQLKYTEAYDNTLHFSPHFQRYAESLATRLIKAYDLFEKDILEIGCGKGDFLLMLCQLGHNRGVGFDPTYVENKKRCEANGKVRFVRDYYSERYKDLRADLIVCRQVLEHIASPRTFLEMIRQAVGPRANTRVFFEVPNSLNIFQRHFVWDIIYEHCSYFTSCSLARVFSSSGFQVKDLIEEYEGQFLCVDAIPNNQKSLGEVDRHNVSQIAAIIESFNLAYTQKLKEWRSVLESVQEKRDRMVIWGAGSKGVTFLNTFKNIAAIKYAVDINPRKQGMYIPGTGQKIVPPNFLKDYQPDVVIVMNPVYQNEIRDMIAGLGLTTTVVSA
jgi:2-polyprenyl-3-methyl-5-hydroxy-6-metoxy-1,4-benzoquinol methylase